MLLSLDNFYVTRVRKNGDACYRNICKKCVCNKKKEKSGYKPAKNYLKNYYFSLGLNIENISKEQRKIDGRKLRYQREKKDGSLEIYRNKTKEKTKIDKRVRQKNRLKNDPEFRLKHYVGVAILQMMTSKGFLKGGQNSSKYLEYSAAELKIHLENLFEPWMTWQNQGKYNPKTWNNNDSTTWTWQLDHIMPHSTFNYTSMEDQSFKDCWALSNLRPYSAKQNILDGTSRTRHKL